MPDRVLLHFEVPLLFQRAEIGQVQLGLVKASHSRAIPITLFLLGLIVLLSMVGLAYAASTRLNRPLKVLERAMQEMAWGRYECRITERGPNDVRSIYNTYNQIAEFTAIRNHPGLRF
ncbi:MAG: HAMP domain-containing protein [Candidatus Competibacteraceae bacterium]